MTTTRSRYVEQTVWPTILEQHHQEELAEEEEELDFGCSLANLAKRIADPLVHQYFLNICQLSRNVSATLICALLSYWSIKMKVRFARG